MLSSVILFITLQGSPAPVVQIVNRFSDVSTCEQVITIINKEEAADPTIRKIGNRLKCVTVVFDDTKPKEEVKEPEVKVETPKSLKHKHDV